MVAIPWQPYIDWTRALAWAITKPAIQWRRFCRTRESYLALRAGDGHAGEAVSKSSETADVADLQADQWQQMAIEWGIEGPWYDLDEQRRLAERAARTTP